MAPPKYFWRHIKGVADHLPEIPFDKAIHRRAEVDQLNSTIFFNDRMFKLDFAVNDAMSVEVLNRG